ncbi:MAG: response regulator [candidate division Zixibacteria bacterium]|nr:response regulator [candidate division Zixibacteria bacterium]
MFSERSSKVLVVDDEPGITEIVDAFLTTAGYDVMVENTSEGAIKRVSAWKPDVILLDIMMPVMDGYDVCAALKKNQATADIPVVFLTGKDASDDQGRSFKSGGNLYVKKPFSCERLLDIVKIVLLSVNK